MLLFFYATKGVIDKSRLYFGLLLSSYISVHYFWIIGKTKVGATGEQPTRGMSMTDEKVIV